MRIQTTLNRVEKFNFFGYGDAQLKVLTNEKQSLTVLIPVFCVRRAKVLDLQRVQLPPGNSVVPAGSNRSGGEDDEAAGASDGKGR
jgi:hypothetical protein